MQRADREIHESSPNAVMGDVRWANGEGHAGGSSGNWMHRLGGSGVVAEGAGRFPACDFIWSSAARACSSINRPARNALSVGSSGDSPLAI